MNDIQHGGLIYRVGEEDFLIGSGENISVLLRERANPDNIRYPLNQLALSNGRFSCTVHGMAGQLADLWNYDISVAELQEMWDKAISLGADVNKGWFFNSACDTVRRFWNERHPDMQVTSFRIQYGDPIFMEALEKGYSLTGGYKGNNDYNIDYRDGVLSGTDFKPSTYGHCIRIFLDGKETVIDNYEGVMTNRYRIENLKELEKNGVFYTSFYLFIKKSSMTESELKRLEAKKLGLWN